MLTGIETPFLAPGERDERAPDDEDDTADIAMFGTETMAELFAAQGRSADAADIYRLLLTRAVEAERREELARKLRALECGPLRRKDGEGSRPPTRAVAASRPVGDRAQAVTPTPRLELPLLVTEAVRAGQTVYAEGKDLVVVAPVNPGGRVVADGHVHVYGPLRGTAVAGFSGCHDARIFCTQLHAELVGVAGALVPAADIPSNRVGRAAQIVWRDGGCVFLPL